MRERIALLRDLGGGRRDSLGLCFPTSLSSALEFRLAGLPAVGYAKEGRSLLLRRALAIPQQVHMSEHFGMLADALMREVGHPVPHEGPAPLRLAPEAMARAQQALAEAGITGDFVVVCPFASGAIDGQNKKWPHFAELAARVASWNLPVVACPGPGEESELAPYKSSLTVLPGLSVDTYAGVLAEASCVIANDTGPGHLAAALGRPLVSVLGPTDPARWGPRGTQVDVLRHWPAWPSVDEVANRTACWVRSASAAQSPAHLVD